MRIERLKIVTLTTLYPSSVQPRHGIFVEERLRKLLKTGEVDATVIVPVPWFPFNSDFFGIYAKYSRTPRTENRHGLNIRYPRYPLIPKVGMTIAPLLMALALVGRIMRLKKTLGNDFVIDSHFLYPDGIAASLIGRWLKLPVILTARGDDVTVYPQYSAPRAMIKWAARTSQKVITVSEDLRIKLIAIGVSPDKVVTLRNGVDRKRFKPRNQASKRLLGVTGMMMLSVGHLIDRKGHSLLIEALTDIKNVSLFIIGEGPSKRKLQKLADRLGVERRVKFVSNMPQDKLVDYYCAADALVLPSIREGMPNVVLESLACGTPVIAAKCEGVSELIGCSAAGILMKERSSAEMVRAFESLMANYPDPAETRAHSKQFDWETPISGLLEVLRNITSSRGH